AGPLLDRFPCLRDRSWLSHRPQRTASEFDLCRLVREPYAHFGANELQRHRRRVEDVPPRIASESHADCYQACAIARRSSALSRLRLASRLSCFNWFLPPRKTRRRTLA